MSNILCVCVCVEGGGDLHNFLKIFFGLEQLWFLSLGSAHEIRWSLRRHQSLQDSQSCRISHPPIVRPHHAQLFSALLVLCSLLLTAARISAIKLLCVSHESAAEGIIVSAVQLARHSLKWMNPFIITEKEHSKALGKKRNYISKYICVYIYVYL